MNKEKFKVSGVVYCECGGQLISNSGKGLFEIDKKRCIVWVACSKCLKKYDSDMVYEQRIEGDEVIYETLQTIILNIIKEWTESCSDGWWYGYEKLFERVAKINSKAKKKQIRSAVKTLLHANKIEYTATYNHDMVLNGSGYFYKAGQDAKI